MSADEVVGPAVDERSLVGPPDRRAGGGDDHGFHVPSWTGMRGGYRRHHLLGTGYGPGPGVNGPVIAAALAQRLSSLNHWSTGAWSSVITGMPSMRRSTRALYELDAGRPGGRSQRGGVERRSDATSTRLPP